MANSIPRVHCVSTVNCSTWVCPSSSLLLPRISTRVQLAGPTVQHQSAVAQRLCLEDMVNFLVLKSP